MTTDLLYKNLTYRIRGCIFTVYNTLGFDHKEKVYSNALAIEFKKQSIPFKGEFPLDVIYDGQKVGVYKPDFIIGNRILLEIKSLPVLIKSNITQLVYYLKGTNFELGILVNFGADKLEIQRRVWSPNQRKSASNL